MASVVHHGLRRGNLQISCIMWALAAASASPAIADRSAFSLRVD